MRIDKVHIKTTFKNLDDFRIDIDEKAMETVLLGLNATGKSNFMEALVIIFRDLDLTYNYNKKQIPVFDYNIKYECRGNFIDITYENGKYSFIMNDVQETIKFTRNVDHYLPKHIFIYYSGISDRLNDLYIPHQKLYYDQIIKKQARSEQFSSIRRIFLAQNIHANFALIAFYLFPDQSDETIQFLRDELKITNFGSALFMLKEPAWGQPKMKDDLFWGADGLVRKLLDDLYEFSFAPIEEKARINVTYKKVETQNRKYLFIKDLADFKKLVDTRYNNKIELFNALESIHISDLLHDVKITVGKESVTGELAMSELSEGEKQLLTVLGLLKFTKDEESLVLLDEPDTHLNPMWKWKYLDYLDTVGQQGTNVKIGYKKADGSVKVTTLTRQEIKQEDALARSAVINDGDKKIGYISLPVFYDDFGNAGGSHCAADIAAELSKLKNEQVQGIVMDLRNNGGGSLGEVIKILGLFIGSGPMVQVKSGNGEVEVLRSNTAQPFYTGPLTVLVNEFSASASEIFAGAIQDYKRGMVIGCNTFGKGTVQTILPLAEGNFGGLKLTVKKFYRVSGGSTQIKGVIPDVILPDPRETGKFRENNKPNALHWDTIDSTAHKIWGLNTDSLAKLGVVKASKNYSFGIIKKNNEWLENHSDQPLKINIYQYNADRLKRIEIALQDHQAEQLPKSIRMKITPSDSEKKNEGSYQEWLQNLSGDIYIYQAANMII
jgi:C-terminal peptidase prc